MTRAAENGVFAFSRIKSEAGIEYLVAVSNSTEAQTVEVETYSDTFTSVYGEGAIEAVDGAAEITVPPLSAVVFKADKTIGATDAPSVSLSVDAESATTAYVNATTGQIDGSQASPKPGTDWGLQLWGDALADGAATEWDAPRPPDGTDAWGVCWHVPVDDFDADLGVIVHSGDTKLYGADIVLKPSSLGETWVTADGAHASRAAADGKAVIHYQRPGGDVDRQSFHTGEVVVDPTACSNGREPLRATAFGAMYEVGL